MLQLIDKNGQVVSTVAAGGWFDLPDGSKVSPAEEGWTNGEYSLTAEPAPPEPTPEELLQAERENMRLSFPQLLIGLVTENWITQADGEIWLTGVLPPTVIATINLLPEAQQFAAKAKATRPSYIARLDPLVGLMAMAQGRSDVEVDTFFRTYVTA